MDIDQDEEEQQYVAPEFNQQQQPGGDADADPSSLLDDMVIDENMSDDAEEEPVNFNQQN